MAETLELVILVDTKKGIVSVRKADGQIKKLGKTAEKTTKKGKKDFDSLWKSMAIGSLVAKGLTASLRTLQRAMSGVVNEAMDFEDQFANVSTLITDSSVDISGMRNEILGMAGELGSATELTKGMYQALSAGVAPGEAVKFIGEAAKFSKAALTDMTSGVDILTTVINAYGLKASEVTHVSDTLFEVIKQGKTTGAELSQSLGLVIPTFAQMGAGLDELGASMATLTKFGHGTDIAVTSLNATMMSVLKPQKEAIKLADELGINFSKAAIKSMGLQKWLADVQSKLKGNTEAMATLFPNVRALRATMTLAGEGAEEYAKQLKNMQDVTGNTDIAFKKQQATLRATITAMKNEFVATLIRALLPAMKDLREWLKENREGMRQFADRITSGIKVIGNIIKIFWDLRNVIIEVTKALVVMWTARKLNSFISKLAEMKTAMAGGMTTAVKFQAAGLAFYTGWRIGRAISDLFGLDDAFAGAFEKGLDFFGLTHKSTAILNENRAEQAAVAKMLRNVATRLGETSENMQTQAAAVRKNRQAYAALPPELKKLVDGLTKTKTAFLEVEKAEKKKIETEKTAKAATEAAVAATNERARVLREELEPAAKKASDAFLEQLNLTEEMIPVNERLTAKVKAYYDEAFPVTDLLEDLTKKTEQSKKEVETFSDAWADAEARMKLIQTAMNGINSLLGKLGVNLNEVAPGVQDVGEGLLTAFTAKDIFSKITGIAQAIGGIVDAIGSLLGGDGIGQAITRENSWMKMNEELTESLRELAKEVGDTHAATSLMLSDIMDQSDITVDNFAEWANRVKEIFIDLERGYISQSEFLETMGASWTKLVGEAQRLGTEGSFEMLSIIREMRNSGQEVAEITEYINRTLNKGLDAFSQYIKVPGDIAREIVDLEKSISDLKIGSKEYTEALEQLDALDMKFSQMTSQENFDRATQYAMAFFNSLQAEGNTMMEIINIMGNQLDTLFDIGQVGEFESGMLSELFGLRQFVTDNEDVINSISASQEMLRAFGNTAFLTQEIFQTSQQDALDFYDQLRAAGGSQVDSLRAVAPLLAEQLWFSEQYNLTLDARTKELIENAKAEGIRLDAMRPIEEVQREMADNIADLVDVFKEWLGLTEDQTKALGKMGSAVRSIADESRRIQMPGFSKTGPAVDRIPEFATGTNRQFVEEDGLFKLHAGEIADVTNDNRMRITPAAAAPAGGEGLGGGRVNNINLNIPISFQSDVVIGGADSTPEEAANQYNQILDDNVGNVRDEIEKVATEVFMERFNV
jgi:TP901 family phage tail tape measure protein